MSSTAKTVLIVAGAGVGVFVLLKLVSPSAASVYGRQPANTGVGTLQGLIGLGSAIGSGIKSLFGGSSSLSSASSSFDAGAYSDPASQSVLSTFDSSNYSVSNGFMFTDSAGRFIAG